MASPALPYASLPLPGLPNSSSPLPDNVLQFSLPVGPLRRFTVADRIEALHWEATEEGARLAFHHWSSLNAHEGGDYISIYRGDERWAAWGATRRGRWVSIWRCATGVDLGEFATMREALAALRSTPLRS